MFPNLGPGEMLMVMLVAVLLFGKRLPEVGRSLGKGIVEFKKGLHGLDDDPNGFQASGGSSYGSNTSSPTRSEPARLPSSESSVPRYEPAGTTDSEPGPLPYQD